MKTAKSDLIATSRNALWFISSESKRLRLSKALASGDKNQIRKAAKEALGSIKCEKTKRQLSNLLQSN